ncbi:MAG TPA: hypothetical protein VE175_13780 [Woeseiaceae bacterium]|nr:hypothetical protein [Woeseiaceae bacterium]
MREDDHGALDSQPDGVMGFNGVAQTDLINETKDWAALATNGKELQIQSLLIHN